MKALITLRRKEHRQCDFLFPQSDTYKKISARDGNYICLFWDLSRNVLELSGHWHRLMQEILWKRPRMVARMRLPVLRISYYLCVLPLTILAASEVAAFDTGNTGLALPSEVTADRTTFKRSFVNGMVPLQFAQLNSPMARVDGGNGTIAVVFPDIGEPYRSVFEQIIKGIEDGASTPIRIYALRQNADQAELVESLKRNGTRGVIALGRQGMRTAVALDLDIPLVVGGVLAVPPNDSSGVTGISLTPEPGLLFGHLKNMIPGVRRVTVIYSTQQNDWLIRTAKEAARAHGLELNALEARDLAGAARLYEIALAASEGKREAIWLPHDTITVDEATILPLVLRESWNRGIPVFSSNFLHAKRGALFALYPDNVELGKSLAGAAQSAIGGDIRKRGMQPLREVRLAVNLRTANHLGLQISYQQQRSFDMTFPEP